MKSVLLTVLFLLAAITLFPAGAPIQQSPVQYAVKFICGKSRGDVVAPGVYFTAINVHNPTGRGFGFRKKFVIAPPFEKPGPPPNVAGADLGPDQAFEIDCEDILKHLVVGEQPTPAFVKGFVVIESRAELDVVAVYTAAGASGQVETLHIERVAPRRQ